ncbi:hypothetical protein P7K49_004449, partial [Saguinus oedipus]
NADSSSCHDLLRQTRLLLQSQVRGKDDLIAETRPVKVAIDRHFLSTQDVPYAAQSLVRQLQGVQELPD